MRRGGRSETVRRGYGRAHRELRARLAPIVARGRTVCWRCGFVIAKGEPWDLGHDDHDRSIYRGPEHRDCNRATAGRTGIAVERTSRRW